jgi:hypothetical protein
MSLNLSIAWNSKAVIMNLLQLPTVHLVKESQSHQGKKNKLLFSEVKFYNYVHFSIKLTITRNSKEFEDCIIFYVLLINYIKEVYFCMI